MNTITHSLHVHVVVNRLGYIGPQRLKHPLRQGCNVGAFDNFSAYFHSHMRKTT